MPPSVKGANPAVDRARGGSGPPRDQRTQAIYSLQLTETGAYEPNIIIIIIISRSGVVPPTRRLCFQPCLVYLLAEVPTE